MGLMRFDISLPERIDDAAVAEAYLSGIDRIAWQVQATLQGSQLMLRRAVSESGNLHVPWPIEGYGRPTLSTGSLMERPEPYRLPLELARGTVGQLRNQLAEWETIGLSIPPQVKQATAEAVKRLSQAAVTQDDPPNSARLAEESIRMALDAGGSLTAAYVEQSIAVRRRGGVKLPTRLGANLGNSLLDQSHSQQFAEAFNAAVVPFTWREIEARESKYQWAVSDRQVQWCRAQKLSLCGGPLLKLEPGSLPDWLYLWEDDFENLLSFASEFTEAVVGRYRGKVNFWQCAGRLNSGEILSLSEQQKLRLAAQSIELVHRLDPDTPVLISFDQPWAEYMSHREMDFPPLHFADALIRAGLDISGIVLEINMGYRPGGTLPRTLLEFSRQLDCWAQLGLPLMVSICVPSDSGDDPMAQRRIKIWPDAWTPLGEQDWIVRYVSLILSKTYVQGIFWNQLRDTDPHEFPHGGLFDAQGRPKPALTSLSAIRQTHLR